MYRTLERWIIRAGYDLTHGVMALWRIPTDNVQAPTPDKLSRLFADGR
jgi:hypothetical protein